PISTVWRASRRRASTIPSKIEANPSPGHPPFVDGVRSATRADVCYLRELPSLFRREFLRTLANIVHTVDGHVLEGLHFAFGSRPADFDAVDLVGLAEAEGDGQFALAEVAAGSGDLALLHLAAGGQRHAGADGTG